MGRKTGSTLILIAAMLFSLHTTANPTFNATDSIPLNFSETYRSDWDYTNNFQPAMPNVTQYLDTEFSDFTPTGSTVYTDTQPVPEYAGTWYDIEVTMTNLHIVNDRDGLGQGAGEIFIEGGINGFTNRYPATGDWPLNDGDDQPLTEVIFSGWALNLIFGIEIRESDTGLDESLGFVSGYLDNLVTETVTLTTDTGDASITFDIVVNQTDNVILASEILDLYKPELWVDDETSSTEMPDFVYGRVISGNDNGVDALVLQYVFYWAAEYAPDAIGGFKTHDNDFEALLIFLDKSDPIKPYRYVFNNWFYTDVSEAPSTTIGIFEDTTNTGLYEYEVNISPSLQGLLGANVTLNAEVHDLAEIADWGYALGFNDNAFSTAPNGVITLEMTVETSYHTFDLGPTLLGGGYYGRAYTITPLTDETIVSMYSIIEDTFEAGVQLWTYFGIDIPNVAPFTFDVTQVFTAPYTITAYANVIDNAAAITRAEKTRLDIEVNGYIGMGFDVPSSMEISYPEQLSYGTNTLTLTLSPNIDQTEITLFYGLSVNISYTFWFMSGEILYDQEGEISINPFTNEITTFAGLLGLGDYEVIDVDINSYLSGGIILHPTLLGTIIEGELNLNLLEVIDFLFGNNPYVAVILFLLDFIVEDFTLTLNATLDAVIRHEIKTDATGVTLSQSSFTFIDNTPQAFDVVIDDGVDLSQGLELTIPQADYDLDFAVDWSIELGLKSPINLVIPDISIPIGTRPSWTANILTATGGSITVPGPSVQQSTSSTPTRTTEQSTAASTNGPMALAIFAYVTIITTIVRRRQ